MPNAWQRRLLWGAEQDYLQRLEDADHLELQI